MLTCSLAKDLIRYDDGPTWIVLFAITQCIPCSCLTSCRVFEFKTEQGMANQSAMGTCAAIGFCNKASIEKLLVDGLLQVDDQQPT